MKKQLNKGFSLVEIMVVLAALGGIALLVTKLGKSSMSMQSEAAITRDYNDLVRESHFLITNSKACKVSLAGTTFSISDSSRPVSIELWTSDTMGRARDKKRYAKADKSGSLTIDDITLQVAKETVGTQTEGVTAPQGATASIKISLIKPKTATAATANFTSNIEHSINITYSVNQTTGLGTIIDCEDISLSTKETAKVWCGTVQNPCGSEIIQAVAIGKYENGSFTGVFQATQPPAPEIKICNGAINQPATLAPCASNFIATQK